MGREEDLDRLYELFHRLESELDGMQRLKECDGYMDWPDRGVYFFFEPDESRETSDYPRLTRIGTHAVSAGSGTSLWNRLRTHRGALSGTYEGGGNHRGSVFRKRVGEALIERDGLQDDFPEWGEGNTADRDLRLEEQELEKRVSECIRNLPFLWTAVDDEPGPGSDRAYIERNAIPSRATTARNHSIHELTSGWDSKAPVRKSENPDCGTSIISTSPSTPHFWTRWRMQSTKRNPHSESRETARIDPGSAVLRQYTGIRSLLFR